MISVVVVQHHICCFKLILSYVEPAKLFAAEFLVPAEVSGVISAEQKPLVMLYILYHTLAVKGMIWGGSPLFLDQLHLKLLVHL